MLCTLLTQHVQLPAAIRQDSQATATIAEVSFVDSLYSINWYHTPAGLCLPLSIIDTTIEY